MFGHLFLVRALLSAIGVWLSAAARGPLRYLDMAVMSALVFAGLWFSLRGRCRLLLVRILVAVPAMFVVSHYAGNLLVDVLAD